MRDILITLPKTIKWTDYKKELALVENFNNMLNFRVPTLPKDCGVGARCFLVHDGRILGYMQITGVVSRDSFECSTLGRHWPAGNYIQRSGPFVYLHEPISHKGFQGWHYFDFPIHS